MAKCSNCPYFRKFDGNVFCGNPDIFLFAEDYENRMKTKIESPNKIWKQNANKYVLKWCPIKSIPKSVVMLVEENEISIPVAIADNGEQLAKILGRSPSGIYRAIKLNTIIKIPKNLQGKNGCKYGKIIEVNIDDC